MGEQLLILLFGLALAVAFTLPFLRRAQRLGVHTDDAQREAARLSIDEPQSLHPFVDPTACIGTGACTAVCPEKDVLGLRHGIAVAVSPARCVGHGLCERACPVEAITLMLGTDKRGVDIPKVRETYQTNVDEIYVVGELGGMGLIRNAFEQARQAVEHMAKNLSSRPRSHAIDIIIVGGGPGGLATALYAQEQGLKTLILEQSGSIGGTVQHYPRKKMVMTQPLTIPSYGILRSREIQKEDLIDIWEKVYAQANIDIAFEHTVTRIQTTPTGVSVETNQGSTHEAHLAVVAIGRRGTPRRLNVPGESQPHVLYSLADPTPFRDARITVVGGGDSAVEAALQLCYEVNATVTLSYRRDAFSRIKPDNLDRLNQAIAREDLVVALSSEVTRIDKTSHTLRHADGSVRTVEADYLFIMIGGELPTAFLAACGIEMDTAFGRPVRQRGASA
ncbi:MAG: FAD-dependent oxidoreductase [Bacteroidetes bacterium]|nr:FAD-dependent oxidoreductase [Bacteroidota bacterium]